MVIDTSALVAIILGEPTAEVLGPLVLQSEALMSAPNLLEAHMVLRKFLGDDVNSVIASCIADLGVTVIAFGDGHAAEACRAFDLYGKGRHPSALNFGDCMAYALAKVSGQSLLFTGADFAGTDIPTAMDSL
jgi:ribonuclease VapC